jgi:hypothetical protein
MFGKLVFDSEMISFLDHTSENKISMLLLTANSNNNFLLEEGNFVKRSNFDINCLSYIPKSKYKGILDGDVNDVFSDELDRIRIKIGRFINKFISKDAMQSYGITPVDIEKFGNLYKAYFAKNEDMLSVVSGNDILKWYLDRNYSTPPNFHGTTLWKSCMRYEERNKYMELYTKNDVKMLIYLTDDGKLRSRALLWDNVYDGEGNRYKVMDRIYSVFEHDVDFFKDWAIKNGYIHRLEQNSKSERVFVKDGKSCRLDLRVELDNHHLDFYPYLDTFKFYNPNNGIISNSSYFQYEYVLVQANGELVGD